MAETAAPIRMLVGRAGQVGLLRLADQILDLNQHQAGVRAGEIALNRVAERRPIDRLAGFGQELAAVFRRQQPLGDERVEQQAAVPRALGRLGGRGICSG